MFCINPISINRAYGRMIFVQPSRAVRCVSIFESTPPWHVQLEVPRWSQSISVQTRTCEFLRTEEMVLGQKNGKKGVILTLCPQIENLRARFSHS